MANKIILVGHGIGYTKEEERPLPADVTLMFAVPSAWKSTGGVSRGHLSGALHHYEEIVAGPATFPEHYLCADVPEINITKLEAFYKGVQSGANDKTCWIACVRGPSEIALSAIITRLENIGLSKPFQIIWTSGHGRRAPPGVPRTYS
ncbi:MAG: hypothetical protein ACREFP_00150 [Acetobacteraceae bacterium]